jgi:hypothetical protein
VLSRLFRRRFLEELEKAHQSGQLEFFSDLQPLQDPQSFARYLHPLREAEWVVYANGASLHRCPKCGVGEMIITEILVRGRSIQSP